MPNANKVVEQQEFSFIASRKAKWYSHFGRQFITRLNIGPLYNPVITFIVFYPDELKTYVHPKTCS